MIEPETLSKEVERQADSPTAEGLATRVTASASAEAPLAPPKTTLRSLRAETEMHAISKALEQTRWNRKRAAELLSISYRGLLYKIRQHRITPRRTLN